MTRGWLGWLSLAVAAAAVAVALVALDLPLSSDGILTVQLADALRAGTFTETVVPPGLPALVAALQPLAGDTERAARWVMVASTALLPLLLALACAPVLGRRAAVVGGGLWLAFPLHAELGAGVWTEPLFFSLVLGFLMLPDAVGVERRWRRVGASAARGALAGLSYLVRPEGLLVFAVDAVVRLASGWRRSARRAVLDAAVAALVAAVLAAPYVVYLHGQSGEWMLSGKSGFNAALAERMSSGNVWQPPDGAVDGVDSVGAGGLADAAQRYARNARRMHDAFLALMSLPGVLLAGAGLYQLARSGHWRVLARSAALAAPCAVIPLFFFVEARLLYGLSLASVPLLCAALRGWLVGSGVEATARASPSLSSLSQSSSPPLSQSSSPPRRATRLLGAALALGTLAAWGYGALGALDRSDSPSAARRELGRAVRERAAGSTMMSISLITPYYAGAAHGGFPTGMTADELWQHAREAGVSFVEVSTFDSAAFDPSLLRLLEDGVVDARYALVHETVRGGESFACFQIVAALRAR